HRQRRLSRPPHNWRSFYEVISMHNLLSKIAALNLRPLLQSAGQGQALSDYPPLRVRCRSRARASLRTRHQGPPIMGFEDEVEQSFGRPLLSDLILSGSHAAATSLVQRNSVPSTQMRCMITASRRASATIAFFIPRCLAIFIAQALSQDHFAERTSMIWAASHTITRILSS